MKLCKECKKEMLKVINKRITEIKYLMKLTRNKEKSDYITALENIREEIKRGD